MVNSRCCCCSFRCGSIIVGAFSMFWSLIFMIPEVIGAMSYYIWKYCYWKELVEYYFLNGIRQNIISRQWQCDLDQLTYLVSFWLIFLASWNGLEALMSVFLIWGACKRTTGFLTAWLMCSMCWIALHGATVIAFLFSTSNLGIIITLSFFGVLFLALSLLSVFTVASFHNELTKLQVQPIVYGTIGLQPMMPPPPPGQYYTGSVPVAYYGGYPSNYYAQPQLQQQQQQQPEMYNTSVSPPGTVNDPSELKRN